MEYGVQLYGCAAEFRRDPRGFFEALAGMGYRLIEPCIALTPRPWPEDQPVPFWTMEETDDFMALARACGLSAVSCHLFGEDLAPAPALAARHGFRQLVIAAPKEAAEQAVCAFAERVVPLADSLRAIDVQLLIHNTPGAIAPRVDGKSLMEAVLERCGGAVGAQLDTGWAAYDGEDPLTYMKKIEPYLRAVHHKEMRRGYEALPPEQTHACLGEGVLDVRAQFAFARDRNLPQIMDQDKSETSMLEDLRRALALVRGFEPDAAQPARSVKKPGDSERITRDYFDSILIKLRHIDAVRADTTLRLFGEKFATPVMSAALSHLDRCWPRGTAELARGMALAGGVNWVGMCTEEELAGICATGARTIRIVKPYEDEALILQQLKNAQSLGCLAVGMDLDHAFSRNGDYCNVLGAPMRPKSLEQLKTYVRATSLPFILKGVLHPDDVRKCVQAGVAGIVVSHHHGLLDYCVPPLMALPELREAARGQLKIFVDCGVQSGLDAFKALALGADGVCVGRALMDELARWGAKGVARQIERYTGELAGAMGFTATPDLAHMDPGVLRLPR